MLSNSALLLAVLPMVREHSALRFDADGDGHIDAGEWREMGMKLGTWSGMTPLAAVRGERATRFTRDGDGFALEDKIVPLLIE